MRAGEFGDLGEDLVVGEGRSEGIPSKSGEEPASDPFEGTPSRGTARDEEEIFWAGLKGGGAGVERSMEPCGPEPVEEAEVCAEEQWEGVKSWGLEEGAEFVEPVDAGAEVECACEPAEEEGAPRRAV